MRGKLKKHSHLPAAATHFKPDLFRPPAATKQVLVFDFGSEVYVWHGKDVPLGDRKVAVKLGKQLYAAIYDYSNCRVNPLDASSTNQEVPQ